MAAFSANAVSSLSLSSASSAPKLNASSSSFLDCTGDANNPTQRRGHRLRWRSARPPLAFSSPPAANTLHHRVEELLRGAAAEEEERMERLIGVVRSELAAAAASISIGEAAALRETMQLVDLIQRLGIPRFFEPQIRTIFNTIYLKWDEKHGLGDGESTVLAFRLLRLDGFHVSPDVIENLKDDEGEFSTFSVESPERISGMVDLYKCTQTGFPSESKIMEEARDFSAKQLGRALLEGDPSVLQQNNLGSEVKFALEYPRRFSQWRIESRSAIRHLWPGTGIKSKCLQLARLDLEMLQKLHREEAAQMTKWWSDTGVTELEFARDGALKCYIAFAVNVSEPQFAAYRAASTMSGCIAYLVDDLFDHASSDLDGLARFVEAFRRWDASLLDDLPDHKFVLTAMQSIVAEQAAESSKAQGRELFPFYEALWEDALAALLKEAEWRINKHIPGWSEYIENAVPSILGITSTWTTVFLMGEAITDDMMKHVGKDSRFMYLVSLVGRLSNDLATFEREARNGEPASAVSCYMKENPDASKEEALVAVQGLIDSAFQELELELFKTRGKVPECVARGIINFAWTMAFFYKRADSFSLATDGEFEGLFKDFMFGSFDFQ